MIGRRCLGFFAVLLSLSGLGWGETYLPQRNGVFHMPEEWLISEGQPFHYRTPATPPGRVLASRAPTAAEAAAIVEISARFQRMESKALLLGDGDHVVHLQYKPPVGDGHLLLSASMDKSITALSAGVALCEGRIALTTRADELLPALAGTVLGESTLRDNLMMASGTTTAFDDSQSLTAQETSDMQAGRRSFMDYMRGRWSQGRGGALVGSTFDYKSQDPLLVGMMVAAAYGQAGKGFRPWQAANFFPRVGTAEPRIQGTDRSGYAQSDGNTRMTLRDWARLAVFVQESRRAEGCYGDFVRQATRTQIRTDHRFARSYDGYGYFIWTDNRDLPGTFAALGYGGQAIIWSAVNSKYLIVFSTRATNAEITAMASLWLSSQ